MNTEQQVSLPEELVVKARERAAVLGLTVEEYIQSLVTRDVQHGQHDPWQQPIPDEVMDKWEQDIREFDEQEKRHPQKAARSAEELVRLLDEEAQQLARNEKG